MQLSKEKRFNDKLKFMNCFNFKWKKYIIANLICWFEVFLNQIEF